MKKLFFIICVFVFISCNGQDKFIRITPENGTLDLMYSEGELGVHGMTEIYFISFIKETGILKNGFIVVKLSRDNGHDKSLAYRLLDSLNECSKSFKMQIGANSNWSPKQKAYWLKMRELEYPVRMRFYDHVRFYIESQSAVSGISKKAFLKYE